MNNHSKGVTLIEMIVVVGIVAVLATVLYINYTNDSKYQADLTRAKAFAVSVPLSLPTAFISEWKFEGLTASSSSAVADDLKDTWSDNDGSPSSSAPTVAEGDDCMVGKCLDFNGTNNYVAAKDASSGILNGKANWTASFWINPDNNSQESCFYSEGDSNTSTTIFKVCVNSDDTLGISLYADGYLNSIGVSEPKIKREKWNQIIVSLKGGDSSSGSLSVWLNGEVVFSINQEMVNYASSNIKYFIGSAVDSSYFKGSIDDIQLYNDYLEQEKYVAEPGAPARPNLSVEADSPTSIIVTYSIPSGASVTKVERINPVNSWSRTSGTNLTDSELTHSTNYCYKAKSCASSNACSGWTSNQCVTTPPAIPDAPSTLTCSGASASSIDCSWSDMDRATTYNFYRTSSPTQDYENLTATSQTDSSLPACNTTYNYAVSACNITGCSDTKTGSGTTTACPINGACGTAVRTFAYDVSEYTGYTQCDSGTPSNTTFPAQGFSETWTCSGTYGGSASGNCTASRNSAPVDGSCGTAVRTFAYDVGEYTGYTQCDSGTPSNTAFPAQGSSETWTCSGENGGSASEACTASRDMLPISQYCGNIIPYNSSGTVNGDTVRCDSYGGMWANVMWANAPESRMNWTNANDYCNSLTYAGTTEWVLPTLAHALNCMASSVCVNNSFIWSSSVSGSVGQVAMLGGQVGSQNIYNLTPFRCRLGN